MFDMLSDPETLSTVVSRIFDISKRLSFWPVLATFVIAAYVFYRHFGRRRSNFKRYMRFLFSPKVWLHPSTMTDVKVVAVSIAISPVRKLILGLTVSAFAVAVAKLLNLGLGSAPWQFQAHFLSITILGVVAFLLYDFAVFLTHYTGHKWKLLWSFHRVHHSAEVLNPVTARRDHPIYDTVERSMQVLFVGLMQGFVLYFWVEGVSRQALFVANLGFVFFAMAGSFLRHSHIWLSFGRFEHIFLSPAQHQLHHSKAPEHWDKNFGLVFSFWDRMFGTLVLAERKRQKIDFGLAGEEIDQPHPGLIQAMIEPFTYARNVIQEQRNASDRDNRQLDPKDVRISDSDKPKDALSGRYLQKLQ